MAAAVPSSEEPREAGADSGPVRADIAAISSQDAGVVPPAAGATGRLRGRITTQPAQAAKHAIVYLENGPLDRTIHAKLDDHQMTFYPYVSVMTVGGTLTYVNSEPFPDSAYSPSRDQWDFGLVESKGSRKRKFTAAGDYTILCRLHPNQVAYLLVVRSSYFVRASEGEYELPNVPAGTYDVVAWAPRTKPERQTATIINGGDIALDFVLKR